MSTVIIFHCRRAFWWYYVLIHHSQWKTYPKTIVSGIQKTCSPEGTSGHFNKLSFSISELQLPFLQRILQTTSTMSSTFTKFVCCCTVQMFLRNIWSNGATTFKEFMYTTVYLSSACFEASMIPVCDHPGIEAFHYVQCCPNQLQRFRMKIMKQLCVWNVCNQFPINYLVHVLIK